MERRLDTVMSMLDEGVAVHDASGDLVYANHAAARWLGFTSPKEVVEAAEHELMARVEIWAEDGTSLDRDRIAQRLRAGRLPQREQIRLALKATGEERWAVVSSEPINTPDGSLLYAVTTIKDVTELKRSEFAQQLLARAGELLGASIDYRAHGPGRGTGGGPAVRRLVLGEHPGSGRGLAAGGLRAQLSRKGWPWPGSSASATRCAWRTARD